MTERLLLGPGPSPVAPRVMRAMAAPVLSHLDPDLMAILDDIRARLGRVFRAGAGAFSFAVSGTGTSGMETAVANLTRPGARAVAVINGYFGDRLAPVTFRLETFPLKPEATNSRSFYFDLQLLHDYWVNRKYHHTISAPLVYALQEALIAVEEEGLDERWQRHRRNHEALVTALQ